MMYIKDSYPMSLREIFEEVSSTLLCGETCVSIWRFKLKWNNSINNLVHFIHTEYQYHLVVLGFNGTKNGAYLKHLGNVRLQTLQRWSELVALLAAFFFGLRIVTVFLSCVWNQPTIKWKIHYKHIHVESFYGSVWRGSIVVYLYCPH